jgi:hypothetical protein
MRPRAEPAAHAPCSKTTKTGGVKYVDKARTPHGLKKLIVKPGIAGKAKIVAKGGGPNFADALGTPSLPLALPIRVQLQTTHGTCWEATYFPAGATRNDSNRCRAGRLSTDAHLDQT